MSEFIQLHVLTSYPPANLNRDDLGRPKTAVFGGTQRLRVSSQSLKRAWRTSDLFQQELSGFIGTRTRTLGQEIVVRELMERGVKKERAEEVARGVAEVFGKLKKEKGAKQPSHEIEQLAHFSANELARIRALMDEVAAGEEVDDEAFKKLLDTGHGSPDIALFGRMLAASPAHNVEAAAQVAHALSVHTVTVEDDFFTAVDDLNRGDEDRGAGHMGTLEFSAGLLYIYVCIDRDLLLKNLDGDETLAKRSLRAFTEAICRVSPTGKQASFASRAWASYLLAERGDAQPRTLSVAFLKPIAGRDLLERAISELESTRKKMDKVYGPAAREQCSFDVHQGRGTLNEVLDFVGR